MGRATNSAVQANANKPKLTKYEGDMAFHCFIRPADFAQTRAVIVTGVPGNFCGHALLHVGPGWYIHTVGFYDVPRFMDESGYMRYLRENGKREIRRWIVPIPDPVGAHQKLVELLSKEWLWLALPSNCVNFVEEVVKAGGSDAGMIFNCPTMEPFTPFL